MQIKFFIKIQNEMTFTEEKTSIYLSKLETHKSFEIPYKDHSFYQALLKMNQNKLIFIQLRNLSPHKLFSKKLIKIIRSFPCKSKRINNLRKLSITHILNLFDNSVFQKIPKLKFKKFNFSKGLSSVNQKIFI